MTVSIAAGDENVLELSARPFVDGGRASLPASRFESAVLHFRPLVKLAHFLWPLCLTLALYFALGGQVRTVDIADSDDSHELASADDDDFIAPTGGETILPPAEVRLVLVTPLNIGAGRTAVSDLFRPPQATRA